MTNVELYLRLVNSLRDFRRSKTWQAEQDRPLLALLEDLYEKLSDADRDTVEAQGWRAWPEEYDARMRALTDLVEVLLDAADDGGADRLPRQPKAA